MKDSTCTSLAKCLLLFTGVCYLISAGVLSYIGIWAFSTYDHFDEIADATITLLPAGIILSVSALMCVIGILAFVAAFRSSKILLAVFFSLVLLVLVGEVLASLIGFVYRKEVESVLKQDLSMAVDKYNNSIFREQIDYLQEKYECCGVEGPWDWQNYGNHTDTAPASCCNTSIILICNTTLGSDSIYNRGCLKVLSREFSNNLICLTGTVLFLLVVQFLALISTCILVCRTRDENKYQSLMEEVGGGLKI